MTEPDSQALGYVPRPDLEKKLLHWFEERHEHEHRGHGVLLLKGPRGADKRKLLDKVLGKEELHNAFEVVTLHSVSDHEVRRETEKESGFLTVIDCFFIAASKWGDPFTSAAATIGRILRTAGLGDPPERAPSETPESFLRKLSNRNPDEKQILLWIDDWQDASAEWTTEMMTCARVLSHSGIPLSVVLVHHYPAGQLTPVKDEMESIAGHEIDVVEVGPLSRDELRTFFEARHQTNVFPVPAILEQESWLASDLRAFWAACALGEIPSENSFRTIAEKMIRELEKTRAGEPPSEVRQPLDEALLLAAAMGDCFMPNLVAEHIHEVQGGDGAQYQAWEDFWFKFLDGDEDGTDDSRTPLASPVPGDREIQEDARDPATPGRRCFIYRFDKPSTRIVLAWACREKLRATMKKTGGMNDPFVSAWNALTDRLDRNFRGSGWERAVPFRIALEESGGRYHLSESMENHRQSIRLLRELPGRIEHARSAMKQDPKKAILLVRLLVWYGDILREFGRPVDALPALEEAYQVSCKNLTDDDWKDTSRVLNELCLARHDCSLLPEAEKAGKEDLSLVRRHLGERHPLVATSLNNIGLVLYDMNRLEEALDYHNRALEIDRIAHQDTTTSLNNIGTVLNCMGRLEEALERSTRALEIRRISLSPNHPRMAVSLHNVASILWRMGRLEEALDHHKRALGIQRIALPPNHPDTAMGLNNMGLVLHDMNRLDEALDHHNRALEIWQIALPSNHPDIGTSLNNVGAVLHAMNRLEEALDYYNQALSIWCDVLPKNHPSIVTCRNNRERVLQAMGGAETP